MKKRILLLVNTFIVILCLSFLPSISAQMYGYSVDIAASDSSALPNNGVEMTIQTLYQPAGNIAWWISDLMANHIWVQFGYVSQRTFSFPGLPNEYKCVPILDVMNVSDSGVFTISNTDPLWKGPQEFANGTFHTFRFEFTSESLLSFYVDNSLAISLTPSYVSNWLINSGKSGNVASFSTVSSSSYPVILGAENAPSGTQNIEVPVAFRILQNGEWHIANSAYTYGSSLGYNFGVKGQLQDSSLKPGEVVMGSWVPSIGDRVYLWQGITTDPISTASPTPSPKTLNPFSSINPIVGFSLALIFGSIVVTIYVTHKKSRHRRRRK